MRRTMNSLFALLVVFISATTNVTYAQGMKKELAKSTTHPLSINTLWQPPVNIAEKNLFFGAGGESRKPGNLLEFIKEDEDGSNPKFEVKDEKGVKWKVKLGPEAQSETAATRLVWAAGYFTDEDYYFPQIKIKGLTTLSRGKSYLAAGGEVTGARLERVIENTQTQSWSWFDNPFAHTKEMNGLRVLMAMLNNWDLKSDNNKIVTENGVTHYMVSDLGATFGKTGDHIIRTRNNIADFLASKFIQKTKAEEVDFVMHSRAHPILLFNLPYYIERTRMEKIAHDIPRSDAKWIGSILANLSDKQLNDAFRAAGYNEQEVSMLTGKIRSRIDELNNLKP